MNKLMSLKQLIAQGEGLTIEFKESRTQLNKDVYETVCAFANRAGGHLFLGVKDNGDVTGIEENAIEQIEKNKVLFENATIPNTYGLLTPDNFTPHPKNPTIAKIFREIGFADELGSGVKNIFKYAKTYGGSDPVIEKGEVFRIKIQTTQETTQEVKRRPTRELVLQELLSNKHLTRDELASIIGVSANAIKQHLANLQRDGLLKRVGSTKAGHWEVLKK